MNTITAIGKYKRILLHVCFWLLYVLIFGSVYGKYGNNLGWYLLESACMLPFIMLATYINIYLVLPYYLKKRKLFLTVLFAFSLLLIASLGERIFLRKLNNLPVTFESLFGLSFLYLFLETSFMVAVAFAIKVVKKWIIQQGEKHEIEKRNLQTELNLLKAQLHPHFLFNTMNNLYALSVEKSAETSAGIAKISELLRSVLYECNDVEIDLKKEITLIENYIDLEKMRYSDTQNIVFEVRGNPDNLKIAPMLLFTFVENAFKHGSLIKSKKHFIKIGLEIIQDSFVFQTQNTKSNEKPNQKKHSGIGLKNVQKRLEIIYPERHFLEITDTSGLFNVYLKINS